MIFTEDDAAECLANFPANLGINTTMEQIVDDLVQVARSLNPILTRLTTDAENESNPAAEGRRIGHLL
ncbi:uncharacterized protein LY89DRAFT_736945 [Mollisia scopiformis]|uniref:Uncharacterized protein n=1 Tax=Mollisia scopiformis TaxID=149040 RepID=A0A194X174_MOLSC|nr:uncharacterized protein LY89DRAFT_736945 [Mollisia scopiformis]KUJ13946.1 hypothetical protein LY89DRAFT_736945 [Mollisia scopiformis]